MTVSISNDTKRLDYLSYCVCINQSKHQSANPVTQSYQTCSEYSIFSIVSVKAVLVNRECLQRGSFSGVSTEQSPFSTEPTADVFSHAIYAVKTKPTTVQSVYAIFGV